MPLIFYDPLAIFWDRWYDSHMAFKTVKRKLKKNGKVTTVKIFKDGVDGTGVNLPFGCGFCNEVHFRSRRQRNDHTQHCPK